MARYGIHVDLYRCTGCMTCVIACKEENLTPPKVWWQRILELESEPLGRIVYFRLACMHCDDPPCIPACPERAIYRNPDGVVLIDHEKCQGHGECLKACPYSVIDVNPDENYFPGKIIQYEYKPDTHRVHPPGKASKCTLCIHRIEQGREPACVAACPSKVMIFGDLDDPQSPIQKKLPQSVELLPSHGAKPRVFYMIPGNLSEEIEQRVTENPHMDR